MSSSIGQQLTYSQTPDIAVPGMIADENLDSKVVSYPAGENIPFGRLCEVDTSGALHLVFGTGATIANNKLVGVSVFDVAREQQLSTTTGSAGSGFYNSGDMVPVLRKGRIFGAWDGSGSQGIFLTPNVNHPSSSDPNGIRGVFSGGTTTTTAGSEITACPAEILEVKDVSASTPAYGGASANSYTFVCLLEVNLPGA
jgi:hypothetical protein